MRFPGWLVWYKKPEYRDIREYATAASTGRRPMSPNGRNKSSIPPLLSLDRVLQNKTCSPMSLYDFYMYLKHIEFSEENLEFYIWYTNFTRKYTSNGHSDKTESTSIHSVPSSAGRSETTITGASDVSLHDEKAGVITADTELARATMDRIELLIGSGGACTAGKCRPKNSHIGFGIDAHAGCQDPRIAELNVIIETYLLPGSPKELNIPPVMREQALADIRSSSAPDSASLAAIADHVYQLLRNCSHRNFVRLGVANGTFETVCVATALGIVLTLGGFLCVFLQAFTPTLGAHSRWNALAPWPMWWVGLSLILSGLRGSCFFLLLFTRRQPLPWEKFDDDASVVERKTGILMLLSRLMIFDRKMRVNDEHLRKLQHKIVLQSLMGGAIFASFWVIFFIFLPIWGETR